MVASLYTETLKIHGQKKKKKTKKKIKKKKKKKRLFGRFTLY